MSLVIKGGSFGEFGPGDLQMLLLRLDREDEVDGGDRRALRVFLCGCNAPQRPPLQRAVLGRVGSFQHCIRRGGQTHAGGRRGTKVGPR